MRPYHVIVADPAWRFGDKLPGPKRGAAKHYQTMSAKDIARMATVRGDVANMTNAQYARAPLDLTMCGQDYRVARDAVLFLWRVAAMPSEALRVATEWDFTPKAELVWVKTAKNGRVRIGMGRTVRNAHEICIIATRGKPAVLRHDIPSVFFAPRTQHSEKPDVFYDIVRSLYPGPRLELFARRPRKGWTCVGNEI